MKSYFYLYLRIHYPTIYEEEKQVIKKNEKKKKRMIEDANNIDNDKQEMNQLPVAVHVTIH